jgi:hypothetical protein
MRRAREQRELGGHHHDRFRFGGIQALLQDLLE